MKFVIAIKIFALLLSLQCVFCSENVDHVEHHVGKTASIQIMITSSISNVERRHACRATWLKWIKHVKGISYSFHVEAPLNDAERKQITEEADFFQDIVVPNITVARDGLIESCSFRRWLAISHDYSIYKEKIDFYLVADDDSFICIHHLLHDSKFWPLNQRVHIAHFTISLPDVISIYSNSLIKEALRVIDASGTDQLKKIPFNDMVKDGILKNIDSINDLRLAYGAKGEASRRYNEIQNGWIGADLLDAHEKASICNTVLSLHQVYPPIMHNLWNHITTKPSPGVYTKPLLSRNINNLDPTYQQ